MNLVQYNDRDGTRRVAIVEDHDRLRTLAGSNTVYALATQAIHAGRSLTSLVTERTDGGRADYGTIVSEKRLLPPVDHPEPGRFWITGTGLTHIGSADARDKMHAVAHGEDEENLTDSMKIFRMGLSGGKPAPGSIGVQPEWFFKGVGTCVVNPEAGMPMPSFALAGGEEAEIVGLYLLGPDAQPWRIGYCLGNEFSDQVTEAQNYLYLAHSKLRACALGPELLLGALPPRVEGRSRIVRDDKVIWEEPFLSGEEHMSHAIHNLEHYHFRYSMFRRPGDLHAYFLGAAVLSCAAGVETRLGDRFEIEAPPFGRPLRNTLEREPDAGIVTVRAL
jgi:hypothetical protein